MRYLMSKVLLWGEQLSEREEHTLSEICLNWHFLKDKMFHKTYQKLKEVLDLFVDARSREKVRKVMSVWDVEFRDVLLHHPREFFSEKRLLSELFVVVKKVWSRVRPKAYIGVGYTDKGNCRIAAEDSSPDWKDVAADPATQAKLAKQSLPPPNYQGQFWKWVEGCNTSVRKRNRVLELADTLEDNFWLKTIPGPTNRERYPFLF